MTSPIVWALMVFGAAGAVAALTVDQLADRAPPRVSEAAVVSESSSAARGVVRLIADRAGHYHADIAVDGRMTRLMVDTGASFVVLRESDARAAGLRPDSSSQTYSVSTANGIVEAKGVRIREMRLGSIIVRDVAAIIMGDEQLGSNLLGMSFLSQLRGFEATSGELTLRD